jgi:hypothetical protein
VGEREVVAHLIGFGQLRQRADVTTAEPTHVEFELQPEAISLEKLVVRGVPGRRRK